MTIEPEKTAPGLPTRSRRERRLPVTGADEASSLGRIRSCSRTLSDGRRWSGRILRTRRGKLGYEAITIPTGPGRPRTTWVHILVLEAVVGPPMTPSHETAHYDGLPSNNRLDNLRWATAQENADDRDRHGRTAHPKGELHGMAVLTAEDVIEMRRIKKQSKVSADYLAARYGVSRWTVSTRCPAGPGGTCDRPEHRLSSDRQPDPLCAQCQHPFRRAGGRDRRLHPRVRLDQSHPGRRRATASSPDMAGCSPPASSACQRCRSSSSPG